ncbi:hypothetical protein FNV43_RR19715 [Rhamnella rubrinervis]|uniref:PB1 domain-containing protein n=1 Tax=Rhamnella rubrinervis TaxID=2594499 RepID=A0A8K0GPS6_9ROSA|nr:hypothetical protein FNV43_RR19715 [Rhamnella rubrinervis]
MGGSGTLGNSQGSCSTTASDSSTVKIKALFYCGCKPKFSESDGKLRIAEAGRLPHLVRLRNDVSYEQFKQIIRSVSPMSYNFRCYEISYYLPGQGLIALTTEEDMKNMIEEFNELLNSIQEPIMLKMSADHEQASTLNTTSNCSTVLMGGSGTSGNSQGSCSTTASDSSTVKIKALIYFDADPTFSAGDGKLQIDEGDLPHFVRLRNHISYKKFKKIVRSLSPTDDDFCSYNICYYLPGQGLIALTTAEDMKNMIEEFDELNRMQEPQMLKIQQENAASSNDCKMEHDQVSKPQWINECDQGSSYEELNMVKTQMVDRKDTSFEDFKRIVRSTYQTSLSSFRYYLPGQGLIALSAEEDMKCMIEEFIELNRIQCPQICKVFKMEDSGTSDDNQGMDSSRASDSSKMKVKVLCYSGCKPIFSSRDSLQYDGDEDVENMMEEFHELNMSLVVDPSPRVSNDSERQYALSGNIALNSYSSLEHSDYHNIPYTLSN